MANITDYLNNRTKKLESTGLGSKISSLFNKPTATPTGNLAATTPGVKQTPYQGSYAQKAGYTTPKPTVTTPPPPKVTLPPAGNQYLDTISKPTTPTTMPNNYSGVQNQTPTNIQAPMSNQTPAPENPYQKYLDSFNKDYQRLSDIQTRNEKQGLDALAEQEKIRLESGGLLSGTNMKLGSADRKASLESAYGAIEESAAARTAGVSQKILENAKEENKPISVGSQLYQKQPDGTYKVIAGGASAEGFTLGKDQVRYDSKGNVIAGNTGGGTVGGSYVQGENPTADAWVKYLSDGGKISDVPDDYKTLALQGKNAVSGTTTSPQQQRGINQADVALKAFDSIFSNPALQNGALNRVISGAVPGSNAANLKESISTVKALIGFDELQKMREASPTGGALGQVSEREIDFLQQLAGSLKTKQSDEQLMKNLQDVKKSFEVLKLVNSPNGTKGSVDGIPFTKTGDGLFFEAPDGTLFKRLPDGNLQKTDFNSVGKTTASNIPQRNLNPGNVKKGGLADKLAVGVDKQGHLIFPDEETGFKAMKLDIEAKINGKSRYLPANPTIAQLGKVYAEDTKWASSVARILGTSTLTPTKNIPINSLIQAIAKQEGYYA